MNRICILLAALMILHWGFVIVVDKFDLDWLLMHLYVLAYFTMMTMNLLCVCKYTYIYS